MPYLGKSPSAGVRQRYQYTATAGQTTFSGTDLGNLTLTYTDNNFVDVFQNGVLLKGGGTDYTATSGTSVVLATGASVSDVIEIIVYDVFSVGNFFNRTDSDSRYVNVDGDTMTGDLTIGDASAADRKILFDGNAQDFHIGLDDSTDSLTIGLGSALGTTSHMVIDANGHITQPLQPAFSVNKSSSQNNMPVNSETTITFDTERFDQNADFASNTFTAPVTGRYQLNANVNMSYLDTDAGFTIIYISTSNKKYLSFIDPGVLASDPDYFTLNHSVVADMDANDTATVSFLQNGGNNIVSVGGGVGDIGTQFSGYLVA